MKPRSATFSNQSFWAVLSCGTVWMDETPKCDHSNENCRAVLSFGAFKCFSIFRKIKCSNFFCCCFHLSRFAIKRLFEWRKLREGWGGYDVEERGGEGMTWRRRVGRVWRGGEGWGGYDVEERGGEGMTWKRRVGRVWRGREGWGGYDVKGMDRMWTSGP